MRGERAGETRDEQTLPKSITEFTAYSLEKQHVAETLNNKEGHFREIKSRMKFYTNLLSAKSIEFNLSPTRQELS